MQKREGTMKFDVVLSWTMTANLPVEADSLEEAQEKAEKSWNDQQGTDELPYSYGPEYLSDSIRAEGEAETP